MLKIWYQAKIQCDHEWTSEGSQRCCTADDEFRMTIDKVNSASFYGKALKHFITRGWVILEDTSKCPECVSGRSEMTEDELFGESD